MSTRSDVNAVGVTESVRRLLWVLSGSSSTVRGSRESGAASTPKEILAVNPSIASGGRFNAGGRRNNSFGFLRIDGLVVFPKEIAAPEAAAHDPAVGTIAIRNDRLKTSTVFGGLRTEAER